MQCHHLEQQWRWSRHRYTVAPATRRQHSAALPHDSVHQHQPTEALATIRSADDYTSTPESSMSRTESATEQVTTESVSDALSSPYTRHDDPATALSTSFGTERLTAPPPSDKRFVCRTTPEKKTTVVTSSLSRNSK